MKHIQLLVLSPKSCPVCKVSPDELEHFHKWGTYIVRDYEAYIEQFEEANTSDDFTDKAKVFEDSRKSQGHCVVFSEENPWYPFANEKEFALAKWFIDSGVPKSRIDEYFNLGLAGSPEDGIISFRSAYSLYKLIDKMDPLLGMESFKYDTVNFRIPG